MGEDREKNSYVYEFDELNRMEKVYRGDGKWAEYSYDGTSARVGKTVGTASSEETETTKYYNLGATVLNEVSSEEGNTTNLIGAGIEARLSVTGSSITSSYFLQKNAHGDVTAAISGTERAATYDYDAFGNTLIEEGEINNPIRYSGEYLDEETGLIYLRARYYDPSVGRFISEDTHWNPINMIYGDNSDKDNSVPNISAIMQSSNLYVYCTNNPIMLVDPTGEYNRWRAVEYALSYATSWDEFGPTVRFAQDCTNFVSWCLKAGGMAESDDWYYNWTIQVGDKVTGSYSLTWSVAEEQFKAFTNCTGEFPNSKYANGPAICVHESRWIPDVIWQYNIQPGDLIYWLDPTTGKMGHAAIIVSVDNGRIKYAQHDSDKDNGDLGYYLDTHHDPRDFQYAYIVRIRDDA